MHWSCWFLGCWLNLAVPWLQHLLNPAACERSQLKVDQNPDAVRLKHQHKLLYALGGPDTVMLACAITRSVHAITCLHMPKQA